MKCARHEPALVIVVSLMVTLAVHARGVERQSGTPDVSPPTPLEQALDEHACSRLPESGAPDSDAYGRCLSAQLLLLRTDFGRDLSKLSASERRTLDSSCSEIRTTRGRDAYLSCLSAQLVSLRNRRNRAKPPPSEAAASVAPTEAAPLASPIVPPAPRARSLSVVWIGVALASVLVAAGGGLLFAKTRRPAPRKCQVCGKDVPESGGLCAACRHDAAETLRRAAAERLDQQRAQEQEQRRQVENDEEQRRQRAQQEEDARLRLVAEAQRRDEDTRQREEEEARQRNQVADAVARATSDPYSILGVPRDATDDAIRAAYEEAKVKYDPSQVDGLSPEVQLHYKTKREAVDLAYQTLTA
jgi:hypothetical protein